MTGQTSKVYYLRHPKNFLVMFEVFPDRVLIDSGFGFQSHSLEAARNVYREYQTCDYKPSIN